MDTKDPSLFGQQSHSQALQTTSTNFTRQPGTAGFDSEEHTLPHPGDRDEPVLVHFNGHFNGHFDGTFVLPNTTYKKSEGQSDAQIAARRAMSKRDSRSFATRMSRTKSRKKEILGRPSKPGITLDTNVSRHRGNEPRQMFPHGKELKSSASAKRVNWRGLGRSGTKNKGLGITREPSQAGIYSETIAPPQFTSYRTDENGVSHRGTDTLDANTTTPGQEFSPWDRTIPIGISIPSDSVPDFSPYQTRRHRAGSDATLVTPSIIITPANQIKSVWSPDTASTPGRGSSIYSRATFNFGQDSSAPPVPALPTNLAKSSSDNSYSQFRGGAPPTRSRNNTLDSAGTAFEDEEDDGKLRDRITSTATYFEEDETPLHERNALSTLSIDTSVVPTPRRSQGWWNVITTPFAMSRTNSVWTQGGRNTEKTPTVPSMPQHFDPNTMSPSTPGTYIWSATEKSPSIRGHSPFVPTSFPTPALNERRLSEHAVFGFDAKTPPTAHNQTTKPENATRSVGDTASVRPNETQFQSRQTPATPDLDIASPISAMSPSPILSTATTGTFMMPRQVSDQQQSQQPLRVIIELQDKRSDANPQPMITNTITNNITNTSADPKPFFTSIESQERRVDANMQTTSAKAPLGAPFYHSHSGYQDRPAEASVQDTRSIGSSNGQTDSAKYNHQDERVGENMQTTRDIAAEAGQAGHANIEHQDKRPGANVQKIGANTMSSSNPFLSKTDFQNRPSERGMQAANASTPLDGPPGGYTNIELQDKLPNRNVQTGSVNAVSTPQPFYANIQLQDKRSGGSAQTTGANTPPARQAAHGSPSTPQYFNVDLSTPSNSATRNQLPVFAPPPKSALKSAHSTYGNGSRSSSPAFAGKLKGQKQHRKISTIMDCVPFLRKFKKEDKKGQDKKEETKKKKKKGGLCCWFCGCCILILVLLAIIIPLTVVFTRKSSPGAKTPDPSSPDQGSQWLNLTSYPPMPTGFSTIAQPEAVKEESGCVVPATVWSCALPKEQQQAVAPNDPDQPNFKLEITFENGTVVDPSKTLPTRRAANAVSVGAFIRSRFLNKRAAPSASPTPPSLDDQKFIGQNTDNNLAPFEGETTPFFITLQDTLDAASSRLVKRAGTNSTGNITSIIPPPVANADGTAAAANLLPIPSAQPLRLYNRGKPEEHYGFYVYYDRSIFLKDIQSSTGRGGNPSDTNGGSAFSAATRRCTWAQTRFLVQIWTKSQSSKTLLNGAASNGSDTDFKRPGTFPYPVSVTTDRHGGDAAQKNVYCYQMKSDGTYNGERDFIFEDRAFGGNLVNPTQGLNITSGPVDGGTGGCSCQWQNWQK